MTVDPERMHDDQFRSDLQDRIQRQAIYIAILRDGCHAQSVRADAAERERDDWRRQHESCVEDVALVQARADRLEKALCEGAVRGESESIRAWCSLTLAALAEPQP